MKFPRTLLLLGLATVNLAAAPSTLLPQDYFFQPLPALEHPVGFELLFGPRQDWVARIVRAIDEAKEEVLLNHYTLTNTRVLDALERAVKRHVVVVALLDDNQGKKAPQVFADLSRRHVPAAAIRGPQGFWNESKYLLVDRREVLTGTSDLTDAAAAAASTLTVVAEPSVIIAYYNHFVATAFPSRATP